ncbi:hypothetical protein ACIPUC_14985 [Streptomyces sp. LARHCF249]
MSYFQLVGLTCYETTDGFGADQVRIYFGFDDLMFFDNNMEEGDEWDLNQSREFTASEKVSVWESDSGSGDDEIGSFLVTWDNPGEHEITLSGDGSHYILRYRIGP